MTDPLSPAAQAILAAMHRSYDHEPTRRAIAAGILRALVDAVVPEEPGPTGMRKSVEQFSYQEYRRAMRQETRADILAVATELESHD